MSWIHAYARCALALTHTCQLCPGRHSLPCVKPPIVPLASAPQDGDSLNLFRYVLLLIVFLLCCRAYNSVLLSETANPIAGSYETLPEGIWLYHHSLRFWCFFPSLKNHRNDELSNTSGITGRTVTLPKRGCRVSRWAGRSGVERIWVQASQGIR